MSEQRLHAPMVPSELADAEAADDVPQARLCLVFHSSHASIPPRPSRPTALVRYHVYRPGTLPRGMRLH